MSFGLVGDVLFGVFCAALLGFWLDARKARWIGRRARRLDGAEPPLDGRAPGVLTPQDRCEGAHERWKAEQRRILQDTPPARRAQRHYNAAPKSKPPQVRWGREP